MEHLTAPYMPTTTLPQRSAVSKAVRLVALFELLKGAVVLLAATGLLALLHQDLNVLAARLVEHTHLNPASKYPHIFLDAVSRLQQPRLLWLAAGAGLYSGVRLLEGYGLLRGRAWAEWLAALSGGVYVPLEVAEALQGPSALNVGLLLANLLVVAVMVRALMQRRKSDARPLP
jgi:uncharacterized membrane protein (DUF2068 family)